MSNYDINDIKSLSFKDGVRTRIQMYLGSDDIEGTYQAFKEIVNNSTDEAIAGYGDKIEIAVSERNNAIYIRFNFLWNRKHHKSEKNQNKNNTYSYSIWTRNLYEEND